MYDMNNMDTNITNLCHTNRWADFVPRKDTGPTNINTCPEEDDLGRKSKGNSDNVVEWNQLLDSFTQNVSIMGWKYVFMQDARSFKRLLWGMFLLGGLGMLVFQIQGQIRAFLDFKTNVQMSRSRRSSLPFPTVTLCSENRIKKSVAQQYGIDTLLLSVYEPDSKNFLPTDLYQLYMVSQVWDWNAVNQYIVPSAQESITQCWFGRASCSHQDFIPVMTSLRGNCYQFNTNGSRSVRGPGISEGLTLILYANQDEYLSVASSAAGFRVHISDYSELSDMIGRGIYVSSGVETSIMLRQQTVKLLPEPYGDCVEDPDYHSLKCEFDCFSEFVSPVCNCCYSGVPCKATRLCNPWDEVACITMQTLSYVYNGGIESCTCKPLCSQTLYRTSISSAIISDWWAQYVTTNLVPFMDPDHLKRDISIVHIYFSDLHSDDFTSVKAYSGMSLLCHVGGALGLFLGSTVLTLVEILDFLMSTCVLLIPFRVTQWKRNKAGTR